MHYSDRIAAKIELRSCGWQWDRKARRWWRTSGGVRVEAKNMDEALFLQRKLSRRT